jgi:predicted CoA-binding protein
VDVVDVFRRPEHVAEITRQAIAIHAVALWLQDGVVDLESARQARAAGMEVVMDDCIMRRHAARQ